MEKQNTTSLPIIKIFDSYLQKSRINCTDIFKSVEYIPLETREDCLINRNAEIYVDQRYIISIAFRQILVFDRENGKFIKEIGKFGQGPDEYAYTDKRSYDERNGTVNVGGWDPNTFIHYDLNGKVQSITKSPFYLGPYHRLDSNSFVGFITNINGNEKKRFVFFNEAGEVLYEIKNDKIFTREIPGRIAAATNECQFFTYQEDVCFKEFYNDTLFSISQNGLSPRYLFETENNTPPYEIKGAKDLYQKLPVYYQFQDFFETEYYLFFTLLLDGEFHSGYFDKNKNKTYIGNDSQCFSFYDDINGFISFKLNNRNLANEVFGHIESYLIHEWITNNPKEYKILQNKIKAFQQIKPEDNPIVVIADLK
ncbi:MAG: 6-bladed beta-propeller [Cyclobacteriaceae bacterium]|nr:6-bladed beta-propeller [Cyclobacteriaceae bacterium]